MRGLALMIALASGCQEPAAVAQPDGGDAVQSGAALVAERGCAGCHEEPGAGTLSGQLTPRPGTQAFGLNLTSDIETGLGGWADIQIARAIRYGIDDDNLPLCAIMPRHKDLSDREVYAIVDYLRGLPPVRRMIPESSCIRGTP